MKDYLSLVPRYLSAHKRRTWLTMVSVAVSVLAAHPKSWLISYDKNQLNWAKADLIAGEISEDLINEKDGVIAVAMNSRNSVQTGTVDLQPGDKVYINTPAGTKEFTV